MWKWIKDLIAKWTKKEVAKRLPKVEESKPKPETTCGCDLTKPICDPDPAKYTPEYVAQNCEFEECGIEADKKIITRFVVIRGESGGCWFLSSLGMDQVQRGPDNRGVYKCFSKDGYRYHIKGYTDVEPQQHNVRTVPLTTSGKYVVVEPRKEG